MHQCPCGSNYIYKNCCGLYIEGSRLPKTAEALMRSLYTEYCTANMDYIKKTMRGKPLVGFQELTAMQWSKSVQWLGLKVIQANSDSSDNDTGFVEFIATYREQGSLKRMHEVSQFKRINDIWYYVDGQQVIKPTHKQKTPRNVPCPCGSMKKFKHCHASTSLYLKDK